MNFSLLLYKLIGLLCKDIVRLLPNFRYILIKDILSFQKLNHIPLIMPFNPLPPSFDANFSQKINFFDFLKGNFTTLDWTTTQAVKPDQLSLIDT
jgi:hypothetical protein